MSQEVNDKSLYTGKPITKDGYMNPELAEKFNDVSLDELDKEVRTKFGPLYKRLNGLAEAAIAASKHLNEPRVDQLQVMNLAHCMMPVADISGLDLEAEFALYQVWLTKKAGLKVEGVQDWDEYFVRTPEELLEDEKLLSNK